MILLWLVALANPVAALNAQARCAAQRVLLEIADRCDALLAAGPKRPPDHPGLRTIEGWTPNTLDFVLIGPHLDRQGIAMLLGEPTLAAGWRRFPTSVQGRTGRCAVSTRATSWSLRFETSAAPGYRPRVDAHCPAPADRARLINVCSAVWPEHVGGLLIDQSRWTTDGVRYQRIPQGVIARFDDPRITPEQLSTVFGPAHGDRYSAAPPLTMTGRRCVAKAQFERGRLTTLTAWQAPPPSVVANRTAPLPAPAQRVITQMERACAAGRPVSINAQALRLAHLYQRYGTPELTLHLPPEVADVGLYQGRHRFTLPGGRCVVEADVFFPLRPLRRVSLMAVE